MTRSSHTPSRIITGTDILVRGEAAAQAQAVDLVRQTAGTGIRAVGPWADELEEAREAARVAGFEQGHREGTTLGLQQGRQQMQEQMDRRLAELAVMLETVLARVEERNQEVCDDIADQMTDLSLEIAEAVLGHEVATAVDPGADAIRRCLDLAPQIGDIAARLHPADLAQLGEVNAVASRKLSVTADPSLQRGDAIITVADTTIDGRLSESLSRVAEALQ